MAKASKLGIKTPDSYYADGKIKGRANKDKNIEGPKTPEKEPPVIRRVINDTLFEPIIQKEDSRFDHRMEKPTFNERPKLIEKSTHTEIPGFLEGFKPGKKK